MHPGQQLDAALAIARAQGYEVRHEHLGGSGTGFCRVGERQWLVVDVAQPVDEQLERVAEAVAALPLPRDAEVPGKLQPLLDRARAGTMNPGQSG